MIWAYGNIPHGVLTPHVGFRGPLRPVQRPPNMANFTFFNVHTFCTNGSTRLWKWCSKVDKYKIVKLVNPNRCIGPYWGATGAQGANPRPKMAPKWSKMVCNGATWSGIAPIWSHMTQYDFRWSEMLQKGPIWSNMTQNGPKWPKMTLNWQKWSDKLQNGQ